MADDAPDFDSLFCRAIEIPSAEGRAAFLAHAAGTDEELRRRLERLVEAHFQAGSFLESPLAPPVDAARPVPGDEAAGSVIGPYKLLEAIGEGGMGTVYMAEQARPVRRTVALKVIKAGMDSRQVLARFEAERQALALMDHPNITRVLDAGATEAGRPYFVMELVRGVPITRYCDERRLTPRERLELFLPVCQAVQHAHQKGVIHRDLKPSNVLVGLYDGVPVPKVIDFGVAKAAGQRLTEATLFTGFGAVVGTPEYMSPEQAQMENLDIDTRSDVYALGVLLYELLTGTTPLDRRRLGRSALLDVLRVIREEEPPSPSTRLSTVEELPSIAACRNVEPRKLSGLVRGELDWIVMKALEKDRTRRYETASGLAADVRRYLDDEPVAAGPPSAWYRLSKAARRHRVALVTTTLVATALVLGTAVSSWQAVRSTRAERELAAALKVADTQRRRAEARSRLARQAVDGMYSQAAEELLRWDPRMQGAARKFTEKALAWYQRFAAERSDDPADRQETALALRRLGYLHYELKQWKQAAAAFRQALAIQEELVRQFPTDRDYRKHLAFILISYSYGEEGHRRAVAIQEGLMAERPTDRDLRMDFVHYSARLALDLNWRREYAEAQKVCRRGVEIMEELAAASPEFATQADYRCLLAGLLLHLGHASAPADLPAAERAYRRSIALYEGLVAGASSDPYPVIGPARLSAYSSPNYTSFADVCCSLSVLLMKTGRAGEAEPYLHHALNCCRRMFALDPDAWQSRGGVVSCSQTLGDLLRDSGRTEEAERVYQEAGRVYQWTRDKLREALDGAEKRAADNPADPELRRVAFVHNRHAWFIASFPLPQFREPTLAVESAKKAVELAPQEGHYWNTLGLAQYRAGDWKAAVAALEKSTELLGDPGGNYNIVFLAMARWQLGEKDDARRWYDRAIAWMEKNAPQDDQLWRFRDEAAALLGLNPLPDKVTSYKFDLP